MRWLTVHGSPYTQNTPLHPVVQLLRRLFATEPGAAAAEQLDALLKTFALRRGAAAVRLAPRPAALAEDLAGVAAARIASARRPSTRWSRCCSRCRSASR